MHRLRIRGRLRRLNHRRKPSLAAASANADFNDLVSRHVEAGRFKINVENEHVVHVDERRPCAKEAQVQPAKVAAAAQGFGEAVSGIICHAGRACDCASAARLRYTKALRAKTQNHCRNAWPQIDVKARPNGDVTASANARLAAGRASQHSSYVGTTSSEIGPTTQT